MLALVLCLMTGGARGRAISQLPSQTLLEQIRTSVVRVDARQCSGVDHVATGFLWSDSSHVVTALHAVSGCSNIAVFYETPGFTRRASVSRVLKRADLALLQIANAPAAAPLQLAQSRPPLYADVLALGYSLNVPKMNGTTLKLRFGGKLLREIVPDGVAKQLEQIGSPDVNLEIVNFEGHLLPGLSGAPIMNGSGKIVAVADGGLENGAASSSWGLPVENIEALAGSTDAKVTNTQHVHELFAVDLQSTAGGTVRCGQVELMKIRTRGFLDLARVTDDPAGLMQLSAVLGFEQTNFEYDIYQHLSSGATVLVPSGVALTPAADMCVARAAGSRMEMKLQVVPLSAATGAQDASVRYEQRIMPGAAGAIWQADPQWTYLAPLSRFDGLTVRRKAVVGGVRTWLGSTPREYLFETLATRGAVFVGSSVTNHDATPETLQAEMQCGAGLQLQQCPRLFADRREWARMVLGVHMTSFPIG